MAETTVKHWPSLGWHCTKTFIEWLIDWLCYHCHGSIILFGRSCEHGKISWARENLVSMRQSHEHEKISWARENLIPPNIFLSCPLRGSVKKSSVWRKINYNPFCSYIGKQMAANTARIKGTSKHFFGLTQVS